MKDMLGSLADGHIDMYKAVCEKVQLLYWIYLNAMYFPVHRGMGENNPHSATDTSRCLTSICTLRALSFIPRCLFRPKYGLAIGRRPGVILSNGEFRCTLYQSCSLTTTTASSPSSKPAFYCDRSLPVDQLSLQPCDHIVAVATSHCCTR